MNAMTATRDRRRQLAVAIAVTLTAGIVSSFVVGGPSDSQRARGALRHARAFARHAKTVHFSATARYEFAAGGRDFSGTTIVVRVSGEGEIEFPERFRILLREGDAGVGETIAIGKKVFQRVGGNSTDVLGAKWVDVAAAVANAPEVINGSDDAALSFETLPAMLRPSELLNVVRAANTPRLVKHHDGVTTVRAPVGLGHFTTEAKNITNADIELAVLDKAPAGSVERVIIRFTGRSLRGSMTYSLRLWQRPVVITAPAVSQVDATPDIEEEAIAAFKDAPTLQPHGMPAGWVLESASVLSADESDEDCTEVELDYTDPKNEDAGYLYLYEFAPSCVKSPPPNRATPFAAGRARGWIEDTDGERVVVMQVGSTMIKVESDLSAADLVTVLSSFGPLTLDKLPPPIPGIASPRPTQ